MTVWYRFLLQVLSGWRITPPYASSFKRNTFNVGLMQIQQLLCLQNSTLNVFYFFCFHGWSIGACFLHLLREDHRSSLKVEIFCRRGFHFTPLFLRLLWGHMKAMPVNLPCQPTEKKGNYCKSPEEDILSETGINAPAVSPFIMKGYAGYTWKPYWLIMNKMWTLCIGDLKK